jgi:iron complex outermembrane receptor protein
MESIEILRGPQGTLFGRNASVGALSLHTARPKFGDTSGQASGEIGNGDRYKLSGYVNLPVGDRAAFRFAGSQQWFKGYWHNDFDGKQVGGTDETVLRGSFRAEAGPFEWLVRADYAKLKGDGATNIDFDASSVSPAQLASFRAFLGGVLPDTDLNDRTLNQFLTADLEDRQWGVNSTLTWNVGDASLRMINAYRDWKSDQLDGDVIFTPVPIISRTGIFDSQSQNHELQFISPQKKWLDGRLDLVAGLYYFREKYNQGERLHMNAQFCNKLVPPGPRPVCNAFLTANGGHNATVQDVFQKVDSYAGYAQANFHLTDKLFATLGGRYSKDKKEGSYSQTTNPFLGTVRAAEALTFPDIDDSRFTYRLGLNYEPTKDQLLFASYSTGYKSAGYNSGAGAPSLTRVPVVPATVPPTFEFKPERRVFDRETVEDFEIGAKTSWLDRKLTLNLTLYRMDINGYQDRAFDGTSFTVRNAGTLRQQGFEFDGIARPLRNVSFQANIAYLDSAFTSYPDAAGLPGIGGTQNLKGKPNPFSPKWSGRFGVDVTGGVGSTGMTWDATSNLSFFSKQFVGLVTDANPQTIQDAYATIGARLSLNGREDRWTVSVFGNNLSDEQYQAGNLYQFLEGSLGLRNGVFPGSTAVRRLHADPRTYGASATFRF